MLHLCYGIKISCVQCARAFADGVPQRASAPRRQPVVFSPPSMTRELQLGRPRSIITVPRAMKAIIFGALAFAAITSPYLENPAADQPPPQFTGDRAPRTPIAVAVPDLPGTVTTTLPADDPGA